MYQNQNIEYLEELAHQNNDTKFAAEEQTQGNVKVAKSIFNLIGDIKKRKAGLNWHKHK